MLYLKCWGLYTFVCRSLLFFIGFFRFYSKNEMTLDCLHCSAAKGHFISVLLSNFIGYLSFYCLHRYLSACNAAHILTFG